jgi:hypothetical protein
VFLKSIIFYKCKTFRVMLAKTCEKVHMLKEETLLLDYL